MNEYRIKHPYYIRRSQSGSVQNEIKVSQIKLINERINYSNRSIEREYTAIKEVFENGILKKVMQIVFIVVVIWHSIFGLPAQAKFEPQVSPTQIEKILNYECGNPSKGGPGARGRAKANKVSAEKKSKKSNEGGSQTGTKSSFSFFAEALSPSHPRRLTNGHVGSNPVAGLSPSNFGKAQGGARITQCTAAEREIQENGPLDQSPKQSQQESQESIKKPSQKEKQIEITAHNGETYTLTEKSESHLTSKHGEAWKIEDPIEAIVDSRGREKIITRINKENRQTFREAVTKTLQDPKTEIIACKMRGTEAVAFRTTNHGKINRYKYGNVVIIATEGQFKNIILKAQPLSFKQLGKLREFGIID